MADSFVDPIVDKIFEACSVYLKDQYRWQTGMKEELERLRENQPKIRAVVYAYTRAQIRDRNPELNSWIWQLRDAVDEADDVLDDFEYEKLEEQVTRNKKQQKVMKVVKRIGKRALMMDPNLKRLEKVVKKLDKVSAEVSTFLPLLENAKQEQQEQQLQLGKDRETGCLPKNVLIGRGEEKDFVMRWLRKLTNEDPNHIVSPTLYKNISVLSIVGHGGMGKTSLLQHIYEDLKQEFDLKMWVCVSHHFDAKKVIADMLECLKEERPRLESLAAVQGSLKAVVQSKRFLLVLDDIWEEENMSKWENVLSPLVHGSLGSKILLTTRMDSVASAIANVIRKKKEILILQGLEEDVCLKLLNTHAFVGVENLRPHKKLTHIANLIVKKLSGSPLAAKVIGGVLNSNLNESFWTNILNSTNVLSVEPEPSCNNIFPILRLSFTFLPQPLQNCFAFCGIFPQDHEFDKDDLVRMWIALGFIQKSSIEGETLEDIGGRYFDVLVRKSFFDKFQEDFLSEIYYKMHDLLHDLAQSISSEECFRFVGNNVSSFRIPKTIRHLFVETENLEVLRMIKDVKSLHSLFLTNERHGQYFTEILADIFKASRSIRLLFIHFPSQKKMSEAIKNLRHLRYLNLIVDLTQMPRSLSSLYHLRFIIYKKVSWAPYSDDFLPGDVSNLSNLRHLEFPDAVRVPGIGKLRSLQGLHEFNVKNENGYRIGELEHLSELRKLKINFLEKVKDAREVRTAKLCEKEKLTDLFMNWGKTVDESEGEVGSLPNIVNSDLDVNVLENLEPYKNLKKLSIVSYEGASPAKWMYNADLISNLEHICLSECPEWETLPPFGQLPHLKLLFLYNMPKAKLLDYKFHGNDKVSVFPSLEVLYMEGLQVLENWFDGAAAYDCFFPCLTELFLKNCPNLQELRYLPPKLTNMHIEKVGWKAALNWKQGSNNCCCTSKSNPLESLDVLSCPNITSLLQADVKLEALRKLRIEGCPNLISLGGLQQVESGIEKFQLILGEVVIDDPSLLPTVNIASMENLTICNNDVLQSLPSSLERFSSLKILCVEKVPQLQQLLHIPASLKELYLADLESLQCLPTSLSTISSLKKLVLDCTPLLDSLPDLPSSLKSLSLRRLDNIQCVPSSLSAISSLKDLRLDSIPLLKSLPDLPFSLYSLSLCSLDNLQCLPSSLSAISSLKDLRLDSIPLLKSLPDLPSSLYSLSLCSLDNLQCLPSSLSVISSLVLLDFDNIPLLKSLPDLPSSLDSLTLYKLDNLECLPSSLSAISSLTRLEFNSIPLLKSLPELPPSLNSLSLSSLDNLQCLPSSLSAISSLKRLSLVSIPLLKSLPELPPSLNSQTLCKLENLQCLPSSLSAISYLNRLELTNLPLLKSLPELPSSMTSLILQSLDSLQCLPSSLSVISSLQNLELRSIPLLKSLPDLPLSLCSLAISNCHPKLMKRYKKLSGSDWHKIAHIPEVSIDYM